MIQLIFHSVFHNSQSFKCLNADFHFSQKNYVILTRYDVMKRSHRKSRLAPFRAENIFRKSDKRNFGCWSSNVKKCAMLGNFKPPLYSFGRGRVKKYNMCEFWRYFKKLYKTLKAELRLHTTIHYKSNGC